MSVHKIKTKPAYNDYDQWKPKMFEWGNSSNSSSLSILVKDTVDHYLPQAVMTFYNLVSRSLLQPRHLPLWFDMNEPVVGLIHCTTNWWLQTHALNDYDISDKPKLTNHVEIKKVFIFMKVILSLSWRVLYRHQYLRHLSKWYKVPQFVRVACTVVIHLTPGIWLLCFG